MLGAIERHLMKNAINIALSLDQLPLSSWALLTPQTSTENIIQRTQTGPGRFSNAVVPLWAAEDPLQD